MRLMIFATLLIAGLASGFGYYDGMGRGTLTEGYTPIGAATGGVVTLGYEPAMGAVTNPAALTLAEGSRLEAGLSPGTWEAWHIYPFPMRDRKRTGMYLGGLSAGFAMPLDVGWYVGASAAKVSDYAMSADIVEYEDDQWHTTAVKMMESDGSLYEVSTAAGFQASRWLSLGFSGGVRLGSGSWEEVVEYYVRDTTEVHGENWTAAEPCLRVGALVSSGRLTGGAVFSTGSKRMPGTLALGTRFSFHVLADGEMGLEYQMQPALTDSLVNLRAFIAVEGIYPGVRSFYSITSRQEHGQHSSTLGGSLGLDIPVGGANLIASVGWNGSDRRNNLFGDYYLSRIESSKRVVSLGTVIEL